MNYTGFYRDIDIRIIWASYSACDPTFRHSHPRPIQYPRRFAPPNLTLAELGFPGLLAVKELNLSYFIEETLLFTIPITVT